MRFRMPPAQAVVETERSTMAADSRTELAVSAIRNSSVQSPDRTAATMRQRGLDCVRASYSTRFARATNPRSGRSSHPVSLPPVLPQKLVFSSRWTKSGGLTGRGAGLVGGVIGPGSGGSIGSGRIGGTGAGCPGIGSGVSGRGVVMSTFRGSGSARERGHRSPAWVESRRCRRTRRRLSSCPRGRLSKRCRSTPVLGHPTCTFATGVPQNRVVSEQRAGRELG